MPTIQFPFTTPANYTYGPKIQVSGGVASLTIGTTGLEFTEDFTDDTDFTYNSVIAEFNGEDFSEASFGANYVSGLDGNWGDGVLTGTGTGGASVAGGKLVLDQTDTRYVDYAGAGNADVLVNEGCIRFKVTPDYSGTPAASKNFITVCQADSNSNNEISIEQVSGTGNVNVRVRDSAGGFIFYTNFIAAWNPTASTEYIFEFNFDVLNGHSTFWLNGVLQGAADVSTGTRTSSIGLLRVGSDVAASMTSDFSIDDVMIFDKPQHWAAHNATYTVGNTNALAGVHQIKTVSEDVSCFATYTTVDELNYGRGTLTGTATGATITGNRLDCTGGGLKYVDYSHTLNGDHTEVGAIKIKVTPNYTGSPAGNYAFFHIGQTAANNNQIQIYHQTATGDIILDVYDSAGVAIINAANLGAWNPTSAQTYEFELDWDLVTGAGATSLFIDGTQFGATQAGVGTRATASMTVIRIGGNRAGTMNQDAYFEDLVIYDKVQHTANYTAGYTLYENLYAEAVITLPTMTYAGDQNIAAWEDFSITETNNTRYIFNGNYWTGAAWAASSDTWATAATEADSNTNIPTLTKADTMIVDAVLQGSSDIDARSGCDTAVVGYSDAQYSEDNPYIVPTTAIYTEGITAFAATVTQPGADTITFTLTVDGVETYWSGAAWVASSGYAQSNTAADVNTNIATLDCTDGKTVYVNSYLHSADGSTTPNVDLITVTYNFHGAAPGDPGVCTVFGYIDDATGTAQAGVVVTATLTTVGLYNSVTTVTRKVISTTTDALGYWELDLINNASMQASVGYEFHILGEGIDSRESKVVPDLPGQNYAALADL